MGRREGGREGGREVMEGQEGRRGSSHLSSLSIVLLFKFSLVIFHFLPQRFGTLLKSAAVLKSLVSLSLHALKH